MSPPSRRGAGCSAMPTNRIFDKYDPIWTKALRDKIQNYKI
jgi:hypothetical protein